LRVAPWVRRCSWAAFVAPLQYCNELFVVIDSLLSRRARNSVPARRLSCAAADRAASDGWGDELANSIKIKVNGLTHGVSASLDTPLLYVLHNELHLHGPRFGCGLAQCGACSVLLDGKEIRSCVTPVAAVSGKSITTLEGLPALYAAQRGTSAAAPALHPLQQAWIDVQVPHCGYCQNGMMIQAADLLATTKNPSEDQIRTAMNGHLCRCGTYPRILTAIQKAAAVMAKGGA
jgi:aerobic-type carbon monoxide dehydrogenase small subunit (CoxS/CutS family)